MPLVMSKEDLELAKPFLLAAARTELTGLHYCPFCWRSYKKQGWLDRHLGKHKKIHMHPEQEEFMSEEIDRVISGR